MNDKMLSRKEVEAMRKRAEYNGDHCGMITGACPVTNNIVPVALDAYEAAMKLFRKFVTCTVRGDYARNENEPRCETCPYPSPECQPSTVMKEVLAMLEQFKGKPNPPTT